MGGSEVAETPAALTWSSCRSVRGCCLRMRHPWNTCEADAKHGCVFSDQPWWAQLQTGSDEERAAVPFGHLTAAMLLNAKTTFSRLGRTHLHLQGSADWFLWTRNLRSPERYCITRWVPRHRLHLGCEVCTWQSRLRDQKPLRCVRREAAVITVLLGWSGAPQAPEMHSLVPRMAGCTPRV